MLTAERKTLVGDRGKAWRKSSGEKRSGDNTATLECEWKARRPCEQASGQHVVHVDTLLREVPQHFDQGVGEGVEIDMEFTIWKAKCQRDGRMTGRGSSRKE